MTQAEKIAKSLLVLLIWLLVWAGLAALVGRELLLPGPLAVLRRLAVLGCDAAFWRMTAASLLRILCGSAIGIVLGTVLAAFTCRFRPAELLLSPLLSVMRATPVASFILLVLIWVGRDILPSVIVVIMAAPVVWANVAAGIRSADPQLIELARVYRFSPMRTLRGIYIPAVTPHFISACRTALGLAWKAGVAAEVLAVPRLSIGRMLFESKLYLETVDLFAWTAVVVVLSLVIEKLLSAAVDRLGRHIPGGADHG